MKRNNWMTVVLGAILVAMICVASPALAYRGWGDGDCPRWGGGGPHGKGGSQGWQGCPGRMQNLTEEQLEKADQERQAFHKETQELRSDIQSKRLALRSEMVKKDTDMAKAKALQTEISDLEAQLDQKRLAHRLKMKAIDPSLGAGFGRGDWDNKRPGRGPGCFRR